MRDLVPLAFGKTATGEKLSVWNENSHFLQKYSAEWEKESLKLPNFPKTESGGVFLLVVLGAVENYVETV